MARLLIMYRWNMKATHGKMAKYKKIVPRDRKRVTLLNIIPLKRAAYLQLGVIEEGRVRPKRANHRPILDMVASDRPRPTPRHSRPRSGGHTV